MRLVRSRGVLLAPLLCLGWACSQNASDDPLLAEIRTLGRQVLAACTAKGHYDDDAQLRLRAHYDDLRQRVREAEGCWSPRTIGEACFQLHSCAVNLRVETQVLVAELERGIGVIRSRSGPWHGMPRLLLTLTEVTHEQGSAADLAESWVDMVVEWADEPKKPWLCAEAARSLINRCKAPDLAVQVVDEGLESLGALRDWSEHDRRSLLVDSDVWITMPGRPHAASAADCLGYLRLVRGFAQLSRGHLSEALDDLLAARAPLRDAANDHRLANVDHELAALWLQLGRDEQAISSAERAERLYAAATWIDAAGTPDENGVQAMRKVKARALARRGRPSDLEEARTLLEQLITPYFLEHPGETNVDALLVWGEVLLAGSGVMASDDQQLLARLLGAVRKHCEPRGDLHLLAQAELLDVQWALRMGAIAKGCEHLARAQQLLRGQRHLSLFVRHQCLVGQAHLAVHEPRAALEVYQVAEQLLNDAVDQERLWSFDAGIGSYLAMHGELLRGAFAAYEALVASSAGEEALPLLYTIVQQFHGFESACLWLGLGTQIDELQLTGETRNKLEALRHDLARQQRQRCESVVGEVLRDRRVAEIETAIADIENGVAARRTELVKRVVPKPASLAEVQSALQPGEVLVECVDLGDCVGAFCITTKGAEVHRLGTGTGVVSAAAACARWSAGSDNESDCSRISAMAEVAKLVFANGHWLQRHLDDLQTRTLLLSLEGELCRVPFAALPWRSRPLVERVAIGHVLSGTVLAQQRRDRSKAVAPGSGGKLLALGNPDYASSRSARAGHRSAVDASDLAPLPATAREVLDVGWLFASDDERKRIPGIADPSRWSGEVRGGRFRLLLGDAARESALTPEALGGVSFLHLACHAKADVESPSLSFLALSLESEPAAGKFDEGLLRLGEFVRLRGDYELLALSACDTGSGVIRGHEGPASMARAGQAAGARRVLATQWRVGDAAARNLVVDFYRAWLKGDGSTTAAAEALAHAQRLAIAKQIPVRDWAAFQLWGEAR